MFSKVFATLAIAVTLAAATATPARRNEPASQCNSGSLQCCETTGTATDPAVATELGLLGIVVQDVTALVGLTCDPITVIGAGGTSCSQQAVCCTDDSFKGLVALGCTPVNLNA